ncbi:MAG: hypothetical protein GQ547_02705 [Methylophaga sp.]|nr:hypothetical protein [Methylophaga sp.]
MKFDGQAELVYQLPKLERKASSNVPLTPDNLERWLSDLPILNIKQLSYQLPKYIQELNRIKVSDKHRFNMLEQLRPTVAYIYDALIKRFRGANLSLSSESQEIQWLLNVVISEMAIGYQRLLFNLAKKDSTWLSRKKYTLLAQRAAYYLGERICLSYLLSTVVPDRVWLELNATYSYAQKSNLNTINIKDKFAYFGSKSGSIDCIYKRILLLTLVSPYSLRSAELEQIYYGLLPWLNCIKLIHVTKQLTNVYVLDFKQDYGPEHQGTIFEGGDKYSIECTELVNKLNTWLDSGDAPASVNHKGMSKKLLTEITSRLGGIKKRVDERFYGRAGQVDVVVGLQDIDVFLGHVKSLVDEANDLPIIDDYYDVSIVSEQEELTDEWGELSSFLPETTLEDKQEVVPVVESAHHGIRQHVFDIENESKRGACLSCNYINGSGLYLGELMFMRGFDPEIWTLGIIRWMLVQNKKLKIGLYLFSAQVEQVVVSHNSSAGDIDINALLLGESEHGDTVLLPSAEFKVGDELQLDHRGNKADIILGDVVWQSEGFAQFCLIAQEVELEELEPDDDFLIPAWAK